MLNPDIDSIFSYSDEREKRYQDRERRRDRDRDRKKSSKDRKHRSERGSTERNDKRSKENATKSKTGTLNSNSGTLGRKNKGGMWEDPQQRLIQEQLDMMRDEEIIELQQRTNKTAAEDERLVNYREVCLVGKRLLEQFLNSIFVYSQK